MADTSDTDGLQGEVSNHDTAGLNPPTPSDSISSATDYHNSNSNDNNSTNTSLVAEPSLSVHSNSTMDVDGDGAPSSSADSSPRHRAVEQLQGEGDSLSVDQSLHHGDGDNLDNKSSQSVGKTAGGSITFDDSSAESTPRRSKANKSPLSHSSTPGRGGGHDLRTLDMTASWGGESSPAAHNVRAGMLADPAKIAREREKEERVRQARERLMEERRRKLEELREQQRVAQENREKQLELRRQKIEDLRRRDHERRAAVEERRRQKEETERARRESILQKAEERVARYEAWKAGGRKGMFGSPNLSVSTSVLYHKRSPQFASMNALSGASSRHDLSRDDRSKTRSTARRDKSKDVGKPKQAEKEGDHMDGKEKKSRAPSTFFDRLATPKYSKRDSTDSSPRDTPPKKDAQIVRVKFADDGTVTIKAKSELSPRKAYSTSNLATMKKRTSLGTKVSTPSGRESSGPARRAPSRDSPRTRPSTGARALSPAHPPAAKSGRSITPVEPRSGSASPRISPPPTTAATPSSVSSSPSHQPSSVSVGEATVSTQAEDVQNMSSTTTTIATQSASSEDGTVPAPSSSPAPRAPSSTQDITAEEYKARLAEKRRQAREKAEREAEEERKRQEEARRIEEEKRRQEEEEERRQEEEALRLAEESRRAEQERLEKAIAAEEKRRKEEAERLEAEKVAKEEAERKAKEEAEKLLKEQQERAKKEEEERLQRKKKLEMIMKRVKPDAGGSSSTESSPLRPQASSKTVSFGNLPGESGGEESPAKAASSPEEEVSSVTPPQEGRAIEPVSDAMMSSIYVQEGDESPLTVPSTVVRSASSDNFLNSRRSPQNLEGSNSQNGDDSAPSSLHSSSTNLNSESGTPVKEGDGESSKPRFKSPLLQQLVENKGLASGGDGSPKFKSPLLQNLLGKTRAGARMGLSASTGDLSPGKEAQSSTAESSTGAPNAMTTSMTEGLTSSSSDKELAHQEHGEEDKDVDTSSDHHNSNTTVVTPNGVKNNGVLLADSALGSSLGFTMGQSGHSSVISNGHHRVQDTDMDDSSISLNCVEDSNTATVQPVGGDQTSGPSNTDQQGNGGQFEELIDLLDTSPASASVKTGSPLIAFEETRRPDITESLS